MDTRTKFHYLLNEIRCSKLSNLIAAISVSLDKYNGDFEIVVAFLLHCVSEKGLQKFWCEFGQGRLTKHQMMSTTALSTFKERLSAKGTLPMNIFL